MLATSSLKNYLDVRNVSNSWVTITATPATFEEKYLYPDFDPIFRSTSKHYNFCSKIAKQVKPSSKFVCVQTPKGLHVVARGNDGEATHFCTEEDNILTWAIMDAMRRKGINVNRANFETLEIDLPDSIDQKTKDSILQFLAASRALGKSKHFGLAAIKRDPAKFARRLDEDAAKIFANKN